MKQPLALCLILIFALAIASRAHGQACGAAPKANVRINEVQYGIDAHAYFVNFLELAGTSGQSLDCFVLFSLDTNGNVKSSFSLQGKSLTGGYFVVAEDSTRFASLFGVAPGAQSGIVNAGSDAGAFWIVYNPANTAVGTSAGNIGGTLFDAAGHADSKGLPALAFHGEGTEFTPGLNADQGGSMFRSNDQDTGDNGADFQLSCHASVTPGSANSDSPCPSATVSPGSLDFGDSAQDVTVANTGSGPLTIFSISPSSGFSMNTDCPASPMKLSSGSQCTISVSSDGSSPDGTLTIIADDSIGEHQVALTASHDCIFCDDFSDNDVSDWKATKSSWIANSGEVTTTLSSKGDFASPDFGGCTDCEFETQVKITAGGRISLFAWHQSSKNTVEICLMQDKQKLLVKQKANLAVAKGAAPFPVLPGTPYSIRATFDGTKFHIFVDGIEKVTFNAIATPFGKAMFRVKSPSGAAVTGAVAGIEVR